VRGRRTPRTSKPRSARCAAAAGPTGPAPITTVRGEEERGCIEPGAAGYSAGSAGRGSSAGRSRRRATGPARPSGSCGDRGAEPAVGTTRITKTTRRRASAKSLVVARCGVWTGWRMWPAWTWLPGAAARAIAAATAGLSVPGARRTVDAFTASARQRGQQAGGWLAKYHIRAVRPSTPRRRGWSSPGEDVEHDPLHRPMQHIVGQYHTRRLGQQGRGGPRSDRRGCRRRSVGPEPCCPRTTSCVASRTT
jgi:hypothetical protein